MASGTRQFDTIMLLEVIEHLDDLRSATFFPRSEDALRGRSHPARAQTLVMAREAGLRPCHEISGLTPRFVRMNIG
jgi:hypothetical protein